MTTTFTLSPQIFHRLRFHSSNLHPSKSSILEFHAFQITPLHVSRRFSNPHQEIVDSVYDRWNWSNGSRRGSRGFADYRYEEDVEGDDDDDDDDDDDGEDDRSMDLLVRFMQNVFKKVSKRGRKAVRLVLPSSICAKLVAFSVDGVLLLTFLWILKAFLEGRHSPFIWQLLQNRFLKPHSNATIVVTSGIKVVCTLASVVFISILLISGIWASISYLQESHTSKSNKFDGDDRAWIGARPAT